MQTSESGAYHGDLVRLLGVQYLLFLSLQQPTVRSATKTSWLLQETLTNREISAVLHELKAVKVLCVLNDILKTSETRRHAVDRYASAGWTMDGRPEVDGYPSAGKVYFTSLWPWPLTSDLENLFINDHSQDEYLWQVSLKSKRKVTWFLYSALSCCASKALRYGPCVTKGSRSFTCHPHTNHTCLYSPVARHHRPLAGTHCAYPRRDIARLSWPGWLVTYRDKCPTPEIEPGYGHPPQY